MISTVKLARDLLVRSFSAAGLQAFDATFLSFLQCRLGGMPWLERLIGAFGRRAVVEALVHWSHLEEDSVVEGRRLATML